MHTHTYTRNVYFCASSVAHLEIMEVHIACLTYCLFAGTSFSLSVYLYFCEVTEVEHYIQPHLLPFLCMPVFLHIDELFKCHLSLSWGIYHFYSFFTPWLPSLMTRLRNTDSAKVSSVVQRVLSKILEMAGGLGGIKGLARCVEMHLCDYIYACMDGCVFACVCVSTTHTHTHTHACPVVASLTGTHTNSFTRSYNLFLNINSFSIILELWRRWMMTGTRGWTRESWSKDTSDSFSKSPFAETFISTLNSLFWPFLCVSVMSTLQHVPSLYFLIFCNSPFSQYLHSLIFFILLFYNHPLSGHTITHHRTLTFNSWCNLI